MEKNNKNNDVLLGEFLEHLLSDISIRNKMKDLIAQYENDDRIAVDNLLSSVAEENQGG